MIRCLSFERTALFLMQIRLDLPNRKSIHTKSIHTKVFVFGVLVWTHSKISSGVSTRVAVLEAPVAFCIHSLRNNLMGKPAGTDGRNLRYFVGHTDGQKIFV